MEQLTKLQIIDETVEYYKTHPRALSPAKTYCVYIDKDGNKCAHSRCLLDEEVIKANQINQQAVTAIDVISLLGDNVHKEQYRGHSKEFWRDIQKLHDYKSHWEDNTLTVLGECFVQELKEKYEKEISTP